MRKIFAVALCLAVLAVVASPVFGDEYPRPRLIMKDEYQLKYPPMPGPTVPPLPEPPRFTKIGEPKSDPMGGRSQPAKPGGEISVSPIKGVDSEVTGGAAIPGSRLGGAALSPRQEARRSLKRLIRDLG